jgi:enoyl-CoA hydratase/carnithine racemase
LTHAPVVSIASIREGATGNGSEIALACDMSFSLSIGEVPAT